MANAIELYQGQDWAQQLSFFTDATQSAPVVFANPVMDVRTGKGERLATFDSTGQREGLAEVTAPGVLSLQMAFDHTDDIPPGSYALDVFADVDGLRVPILKRGVLALKVTARVTVDDAPVVLVGVG
jgi:hypothetical protein